MLPEALLVHSVRGDEVAPHFLDAADHPWLRLLAEEFDRFVGRPQHELDARLREPLAVPAPVGKRRLATHVLSRLHRGRTVSAVEPARARAALFTEAARDRGGERRAIFDAVAAALDVGADALEESLFADLPGERRVVAPPAPLSSSEIALRANLALAQGFLFRSTRVTVTLGAEARRIVRQAKLRGLLCVVEPRETGAPALVVSGPLALFHKTLLYGRRLAELLPLLAWSGAYRLEAECVVRDRARVLRLSSGAPIQPSSEPRRFDSTLEERFARDFARAAPRWDVVREPEPVQVAGTIIFPDFALQHRDHPSRRWLVEIVGFWTPGYLERKLAHLRAAHRRDLILCVDDALACAEDALPTDARVVRFRRRVDPRSILAIVEADGACATARSA